MTGALKAIAALALLCLFAGCGLKGPLYLPDEQAEAIPAESGTSAPRKRPTTPQPAPQSQKEDAAESEEAPQVGAPDPARPSAAEPVAPPRR